MSGRLLCGQVPRGSGSASAPRVRLALALVLGGFVSLPKPSFFRWLLSVGMGPFYGMVRVHLAQLVEHALRMRKAMGSRPGGGFPCLARFGPQHFLAFLVRAAPVSLCSMVSPARGMTWMRKRRSLPAGLPDSFGIALQVWYCCSIATC